MTRILMWITQIMVLQHISVSELIHVSIMTMFL